jgi:hypothetical protein
LPQPLDKANTPIYISFEREVIGLVPSPNIGVEDNPDYLFR